VGHQKFVNRFREKYKHAKTIMPLSTKLDRKLRATQDDTDEESYYEQTDESSPSVIDTGEGGDILSSESEGAEGLDDEAELVGLYYWAFHGNLTLTSQTCQPQIDFKTSSAKFRSES
jgi:hypothetical protein